ncbi:hypothetical protein AGLY_016538 [Aphis glycines]|uniref:Peptidase S1 domain-containing protein n=1 Tax=Aphis glycines TaxID=307491 RepID=A0A6G0SXG3_APHGL|nr:hypothetical protein AGLY_016538 [Aphis glycines]
MYADKLYSERSVELKRIFYGCSGYIPLRVWNMVPGSDSVWIQPYELSIKESISYADTQILFYYLCDFSYYFNTVHYQFKIIKRCPSCIKCLHQVDKRNEVIILSLEFLFKLLFSIFSFIHDDLISDVFHLTLISEHGPAVDFSGAGISFNHSNHFYLTGVLSITNYVEWIRKEIKFCILPNVEGVIYSFEDSNETIAYGTIIMQNHIIIENCDVGYYKAYPNAFKFCQENGKWLTSSKKLCLKMCPPLLSDSLDFECSLNGKFANCSKPSIPETKAIQSCKPTHILPNGHEESATELFCQSNGTWNNQLYECTPSQLIIFRRVCGSVYSSHPLPTINAKKQLFGTAPWNVRIYRLNKNHNINYDLICGGSIIAPKLVITAAHCFWYTGILTNNISITDDSYKVATSEYDRYFTIDDNNFTLMMNVETIYLQEDYHDFFYAYYLAIIVLSNEISFSNSVTPICVDWNSKYHVLDGDKGKIVGWEGTEENKRSNVLIEASLTYIDQNSCRNFYTDGFKTFFTKDKFCGSTTLGHILSETLHNRNRTAIAISCGLASFDNKLKNVGYSKSCAVLAYRSDILHVLSECRHFERTGLGKVISEVNVTSNILV